MNLPSALIRQVLKLNDFDTWNKVRKHYLPAEYASLYDAIDKHVTRYHKLPDLDDLKLSIRDNTTLEKVYALEGIDTDAEPFLLLDYLKNEYAQKEVLIQLEKYVDNTVSMETAEDVVKSLQAISLEIERKVEIRPEEESMQKMSPFDTEEDLARRITLGLNAEFDAAFDFSATSYILMGGKRGSGKSITCTNIARRTIEDMQKTALFFSIEMQAREVLQRDIAMATKVPLSKLIKKNLTLIEWEKVAKFWASRYENGDVHLEAYREHRSFDRFHSAISKELLVGPQLDIVYDPYLTIARIRSELDKRVALGVEIGVIIVDYINQVRLKPDATRMYDWIEQIEVSKALKTIAQEYGIPVFSPYQTDAGGEARFAKGILDSADAAMVLEAHEDCISFRVTKMRHADDEVVFTSAMAWSTLTIGPDSAEPPPPEEDEEKPKKRKAKERIGGNSKTVNPDVYDDPPF